MRNSVLAIFFLEKYHKIYKLSKLKFRTPYKNSQQMEAVLFLAVLCRRGVHRLLLSGDVFCQICSHYKEKVPLPLPDRRDIFLIVADSRKALRFISTMSDQEQG